MSEIKWNEIPVDSPKPSPKFLLAEAFNRADDMAMDLLDANDARASLKDTLEALLARVDELEPTNLISNLCTVENELVSAITRIETALVALRAIRGDR